MTEDQKEAYNSKARLRMRNLRQEKKNEPKKKLNAAQAAKQRKKWRDEKAKQRAKVTPTKKLQKDMLSCSRTLNKLTPDQLIEFLDTHVTPTKRKYLSQKNVYNSPNSRKEIPVMRDLVGDMATHLKQNAKCDNESIRRRIMLTKYLARKKKRQSAKYRKLLGMRWHTWKDNKERDEEWKRTTRKDKKEAATKMAAAFLRDVSVPIPNKRYAKKSVLPDTLRSLYQQYLRQNSQDNYLCFSLFKSSKPKAVLTQKYAHLYGCMCEYCLNIDYEVCFCLFFLMCI